MIRYRLIRRHFKIKKGVEQSVEIKTREKSFIRFEVIGVLAVLQVVTVVIFRAMA